MLYSTRPTIVKLTKAQYDALDPADKTNDTIYFITDVNGTGDKFQPTIYSGQEIEIGVWTNGKPIYQKTLTCTTATDIGPNDWATIPWDSEPSDIEFLVTGQIHQGDVPNSYATVRAAYTGGHVKLAALYSSTFGANAKLTIWYTKTTDTAGSGIWTPQGVPAVHYSTDEQVVGTWIDGSTIYEKTIHFVPTNPIEPTTETDLYIEDIPSNMLAVLDITVIGGLKGSSQNIIFRRPFVFNYANTISSSSFKGSALVVTEVWQNEKHIKVYTGDNYANVVAVSTDNRICEFDIILRYTKSSS